MYMYSNKTQDKSLEYQISIGAFMQNISLNDSVI